MHLATFEPFSTDPRWLVDRAADVRRVRARIEEGLRRGASGTLTSVGGLPGVGKSIVARAALRDVRLRHSGDTVFVRADCCDLGSRHRALVEVVDGVARELADLAAAGGQVSDAVVESAQVLSTVTRARGASRRALQRRLARFKAPALAGRRRLMESLDVGLDVVPERSVDLVPDEPFEPSWEALLDVARALLEGLDEHGIRTVVLLDDLDKLKAGRPFDDEETWWETDARSLLDLWRAPGVLVVTGGEWVERILPPGQRSSPWLEPLGSAARLRVVDGRLDPLDDQARRQLADTGVGEWLDHLESMAPSVGALLVWFQFLAERARPGDASPAVLARLAEYPGSYFGRTPLDVLLDVGNLYDPPSAAVADEDLVRTCRGPQQRDELRASRVLVPSDPRSPTHLRLHPELHFLARRHQPTWRGDV